MNDFYAVRRSSELVPVRFSLMPYPRYDFLKRTRSAHSKLQQKAGRLRRLEWVGEIMRSYRERGFPSNGCYFFTLKNSRSFLNFRYPLNIFCFKLFLLPGKFHSSKFNLSYFSYCQWIAGYGGVSLMTDRQRLPFHEKSSVSLVIYKTPRF